MRQFGLIGFPLSHSFSKKYFSEKFEREKISDCSYELYPLEEINLLKDLLERVNLQGLNVTIPYKESVIPFLQELDETARAAGAVNTIKIQKRGNSFHLKGYNTDTSGFEMTLKPLLQPHHHKALILGSGGASKAVKYVLKKLGIDFIIVSRNPETDNREEISYSELNEYALKNFPLIINTTPLGMYPDIENCPPLPYEFLSETNFLYDLVYNPEETKFLKSGKEKGAIVQNGLSMLKLQAEKAWEIWN